MITSIVPFKTVLLQTLFLLVAIAVESSFLYEFLRYSRKTSLEYAIAMNLFATIVGWVIFFTVIPLTGSAIKTQFMDFIFLNKVLPKFDVLAVLIIVILFISLFLLKQLMFTSLKKIKTFSLQPKINLHNKYKPIFQKPIKPIIKNRVILWGHSCSHMIILLLLLLINWNSQ